MPGIDVTKPEESSNSDDDNNESSISTNKKEEEEETSKIYENKMNDKHLKDNKTQFEYGKKLFKKALKYLNMSKEKGSSASSEFITKYIKEIDIEQDQTHKQNE